MNTPRPRLPSVHGPTATRAVLRVLLRVGLVGLALAWVYDSALSCTTPVFRYALERWRPSAYQAVVFHQGPLSSNDLATLDLLRTPQTQGLANLALETVDLLTETNPEPLRLWQSQRNPRPPWLVVRYPDSKPPTPDAWAGPLTSENVRGLLDSPARHQTVRHLAEGATAVWLVLEGRDPAQTDSVHQALAGYVRSHHRTLEVSLDPDEPTNVTQMPITFPLVRLSRTNAAEAVFRSMLENYDEDQKGPRSEPVVIPIFGRGRALVALPGDKVTSNIVAEIAAFITSACSCEVKEQNPGLDLLMTADWEAVAEGKRLSEPPVPPLVGIAPAAPTTNSAPPVSHRATPSRPTPPASVASPLVRNLALTGAAALVLVALLSWFLRGRKGGS